MKINEIKNIISSFIDRIYNIISSFIDRIYNIIPADPKPNKVFEEVEYSYISKHIKTAFDWMDNNGYRIVYNQDIYRIQKRTNNEWKFINKMMIVYPCPLSVIVDFKYFDQVLSWIILSMENQS